MFVEKRGPKERAGLGVGVGGMCGREVAMGLFLCRRSRDRRLLYFLIHEAYRCLRRAFNMLVQIWCVHHVCIVVHYKDKSTLSLLSAYSAEYLVATHGTETGQCVLPIGVIRFGVTDSGILTDILRQTGGVACRTADFFSGDHRREGGSAVLAGSAGEEELMICFVFLGVEQVGAVEELAVVHER